MYGWANHRVALDDLIGFAWSAPMRELAAKVGLSDVGLKKVLRSHGVEAPPQGYWNKVHAGRRVPGRPQAPARGPGETPYVWVDKRFAILPAAPVPSSAGPFASGKVPEDLEQLRAEELVRIGRAASAARMAVPHPAIQALLDRDEKEKAKAAASSWPTTARLLYDSPFEKRRLRILNAVFATLTKRGHSAQSYTRDDYADFTVFIGSSHISVHLDEAGGKATGYSRYRLSRPDPARRASVKLKSTAGAKRWQDDAAGPLESKIAQICAGIIVEGERAYRDSLRQQEAEVERQLIEADKRRREQLERANADRTQALLESGSLLARADHLRSLIAKVAAAVSDGQVSLGPNELATWREWAEAQADRLDPIISGQVYAHLRPPFLD